MAHFLVLILDGLQYTYTHVALRGFPSEDLCVISKVAISGVLKTQVWIGISAWAK